MICPGKTPITSINDDDDVIDFAGIVNIFGSSSALICIVFCLTDSEDEGLLLTRISEFPFSIVSPTALLLLPVFILFPSRKTCEILKDSKLSNSIKSAMNPGAIAPEFFNPKYLAVLIDAI